MRFKVGSAADESLLGPIDFAGILNSYKNQGPCDFYKYGPAVVATAKYAQVSFSLEDEDDWDEVEKMGPSGADLIKFAQLNPAPREWYDEAH